MSGQIPEVKYSRNFWKLVDKVINDGLTGVAELTEESVDYAIETSMPDDMKKVLYVLGENVFLMENEYATGDQSMQDKLLDILMSNVRKKVHEKLGLSF